MAIFEVTKPRLTVHLLTVAMISDLFAGTTD